MALTKVPRRYFPCRYRYLITLFASSLAVVCLNNLFYCFNGDTEIDGPALVRFDPNTSEVARNGSLGVFRIAIPQYFPKANRRQFERVIVIGTLRNPDEQEAISRGSLMTGFHLHFESTKTPAEEHDNAGKFSKGSEADTGAFHMHLNAIQRVVAESFASALIMEKTVDWDVNLKMQLKGLASGMRLMQESNASAALPYGDRWDLLWLGHCGMRCAAASSFLLAPHDITAVPSRHLMSYRREPPAGVKNHMRLACQIEEAVGSVAYAVTNEGAQKLLTALLEVAPKQEKRFDVVASRLCQTEVLSCFSTYPAIMGRRSVDCEKGQKDSNAVDLNEDCPSGVMFSTLDNLDSLSNSTSKVKSAYQDAVIKEIDPAQFEVPHTMFKWRDDRGEHEISL